MQGCSYKRLRNGMTEESDHGNDIQLSNVKSDRCTNAGIASNHGAGKEGRKEGRKKRGLPARTDVRGIFRIGVSLGLHRLKICTAV